LTNRHFFTSLRNRILQLCESVSSIAYADLFPRPVVTAEEPNNVTDEREQNIALAYRRKEVARQPRFAP
jgi:hypothetical protein